MTIFQIMLILRARWRQILLVLLLTILATLALSMTLPKTYKATAVALLNFKGTDPVSGSVLAAQLVPGYMATQIDIVTSKDVALKAVDNLGLVDNPTMRKEFNTAGDDRGAIRDWLADRLLKSIEVVPARESSVLAITARDSNPAMAAAIANGFAYAYQQVNLKLKVEPLQKAANYFSDQIKVLRANFEEAEQKLSQYQQQHGLVSTDNRLDVENTRLNDLASQLVVAQGQTMEASSREHLVQDGRGNESPDVIANPLIQSLKNEVAQAESKFMQLSQNLDKNHPQYQAAKAEVDRLRAELDHNIANTTASVSNNARILRQREGEVKAALDAQKAKMLELNRTRDEMLVLEKEADSAQRAYDGATQRYMQTNMEGQSNQSDVSILTPAVAPRSASSPNLIFNTVLSIALGTMLGIVYALIAEMIAPRVRSTTDLVDVLNAPVFGSLAWDGTAERRFLPFGKDRALPSFSEGTRT